MNRVLILACFIVAVCSGPVFSQQQNGRCGDGICDEFEKTHPDLCRRDCRQVVLGGASKKYIDPDAPKMYVSFVVNINDWIDHDLSAETLSRLIDIYDKYNVKADLYFTEPVLKAYEKYHPELIWKIKKSGMSIGYHFRPPHPAYDMFKGRDGILRSKENLVKSGNDCRAVKSLSYAEKVRILSDFESYALKTDDWPPEGWPVNQDGYCSSFDKGEIGGYKYVASVFEVSPVISGISNIIDEELRKAEAEVLKKMGTKIFVTEHFGNSRDNPDNAFEEKYGLLTRPSDIGLSFFEGPLKETSVPSVAAQRLLEQAKRINFDRPMFGVLAVHDHDFNKIMGWDMSKILGSKILRPQADREKLFKEYEEAVRLLVEDKNVMPVSADQIYGLYQKTRDNSQLSQGEISGGNPFATVFIVHCETGRNVHAGSRLESYPALKWEEKHWPSLINLVNLADKYGIKLTFGFTPQWAEYILSDKGRAAQLKKWHDKGHEIALQHHPTDMPSSHPPEFADWDGYTDKTSGIYKDSPYYKGTIDEMMELMDRLAGAVDDRILSVVGGGTENRWDKGIIYQTEGNPLPAARSKPVKQARPGGFEITYTGMSYLNTVKPEILSQFKAEYAKCRQDEVFAVVIHEFNFANAPDIVEEWFRFIKEKGVKEGAVRDVIEDYQKQPKR